MEFQMNDQTIDALRNDLINDQFCHCGECHKVVAIEKAVLIDGYFYCPQCAGEDASEGEKQ